MAPIVPAVRGAWERGKPHPPDAVTEGAPMTTRWTLTFDCHDATVMARFWIVALG
jgi:hypothetical protein